MAGPGKLERGYMETKSRRHWEESESKKDWEAGQISVKRTATDGVAAGGLREYPVFRVCVAVSASCKRAVSPGLCLLSIYSQACQHVV